MSNLLARGVARWQRHYSQGESSEGGFTLVELIVVVVLIPVVVGALAISLMSILSLQNTTGNDVALSGNGMTMASFFNQDVQSAQEFTTCPNVLSNQPTCTPPTGNQQPASQCGTTGAMLFSVSPDYGHTIISYVGIPVVDPTTQQTIFNIEREVCASSSLSQPTRVDVVVHGVASAQVTFSEVDCVNGTQTGTTLVASCFTTSSSLASTSFSLTSSGGRWIYTGQSTCMPGTSGSTTTVPSGGSVTAVTDVSVTITEPATNLANTSSVTTTTSATSGKSLTFTAAPLAAAQYMQDPTCSGGAGGFTTTTGH